MTPKQVARLVLAERLVRISDHHVSIDDDIDLVSSIKFRPERRATIHLLYQTMLLRIYQREISAKVPPEVADVSGGELVLSRPL